MSYSPFWHATGEGSDHDDELPKYNFGPYEFITWVTQSTDAILEQCVLAQLYDYCTHQRTNFLILTTVGTILVGVIDRLLISCLVRALGLWLLFARPHQAVSFRTFTL